MIESRGWIVALVWAVLVPSCGGERSGAPHEDRSASLGGDAAARVGDEAIPLSIVASVARAQKITAEEAIRKVVDDAIAAAAARSRALDRQQPAAWRLVSARARMASDRLLEEARGKGPPTDEEIAVLSEQHWAEVDRPPSFRVIHAIVMRPKDEALIASARALGGALRDAVLPAADARDFDARAKAAPHDAKLEIRVEELPPFTDKGWVTEGGGRMDEDFAKAAASLEAPGATSGVVETPFGWHVIRLLEVVPERRMPIEARRIAFGEEVYASRARAMLRARLDLLRAADTVTISPASEQLMRTVTFSGSEATRSP